MIVEFKLDTKDGGDLAVLDFLFSHLKPDVSDAPEPKEGKPTGKKRGPKPKQTKGAEGKSESEIKEMDFAELSKYLLHKEEDPTEFEVRWFAKQWKKKHDNMDDVREVIHELGAQNFTDLKAKSYKKFCTLLAEKDASITSASDDDDLEV